MRRFYGLKPTLTRPPGWLLLGLLLGLLILGGCGAKTDDPQAGTSVAATPVPTAPRILTPEATLTATLPSAEAPRALPKTATPTPMPPLVPVTATPTATSPFLHTTNILLLGSDRRPNEVNWRTDVIMILALDFEKGVAGVISLPRDLYIDEIPDHKPNKINVVDYLGEMDEPDGGGPALLASILEERMGVPIQHYLRFEFEGFKQVIDALGGVEIQVPRRSSICSIKLETERPLAVDNT